MASKKKLYSIIVTAVVLLVVTIGAVVWVNSTRTPPQKPQVEQQAQPDREESESSPQNEAPEKSPDDDQALEIDPALVGSLSIPPAGLAVSYMKGVGGFEYEVLRAEGGRRYVELRNNELVGSRCDKDEGVFASIIESPSESEQATLAKTTDVDGVKYGLSLALPTCTDNEPLLKSYQDAFSRPFGLLKKL